MGFFLYDCDTVMAIKQDILDTLEDCNHITEEMCKKNMFFFIATGNFADFLLRYYKMYSQNQAHKDSERTLKIRSLKTDETM